MRSLASFLQNPFDDPQISMAELLAFATDHHQRLLANNTGGQFDDRIAPLNSAITRVEECVTDDWGRLGLRKARKKAKDDFRAQIPAEVKRIEAGFIAAFGADSPRVLEALPQGRTVFQNCRDDQMESHLQTLQNATTVHQASLAPATVTLATNLKTNWVTLYHASEASTGSKTTTQQGKKQARENLQLILFLNLLQIAEIFPRQPEKLALYMQQHLLKNPSAPKDPKP